MTGDENGPISGRERLIVSAILGVVAGMTLIDVVADSYSGGSLPHISIELLTAAAAALALGWMWIRFFRLRHGLDAARRSLEGARAEAARWRDRHGEMLQGLSRAIDQQLDAWALTPAEKEVAFLLLKGLSFKEIAPVRGASERTVRQQALAVYAKSGLAGRAELSAFFLEDLLAAPAPTDATSPPA